MLFFVHLYIIQLLKNWKQIFFSNVWLCCSLVIPLTIKFLHAVIIINIHLCWIDHRKTLIIFPTHTLLIKRPIFINIFLKHSNKPNQCVSVCLSPLPPLPPTSTTTPYLFVWFSLSRWHRVHHLGLVWVVFVCNKITKSVTKEQKKKKKKYARETLKQLILAAWKCPSQLKTCLHAGSSTVGTVL